MKFKVGDKVKILPSAAIIGVEKSEVGKVVKVRCVFGDDILINDSRGKMYGTWSVNSYDITPAIKVGQQLLFDFMR